MVDLSGRPKGSHDQLWSKQPPAVADDFVKTVITTPFTGYAIGNNKAREATKQRKEKVMKKTKRILALALALIMSLSMSIAAFATEEPEATKHTITITNTDQNVSHTYEAYQVFAGDLDKEGQGTKLSNIEWGTGVDGAGILADLKATDDPNLLATSDITWKPGEGTEGEPGYVAPQVIEAGKSLFKYCENAADVADVISGFASTGAWNADGTATTGNNGGVDIPASQIDAFATVVADNLSSTKVAFTEGTGDNAGKYTAEVTGDGYYFVKDVTTTLQDDTTKKSDTLSKYLMAVVKDTTIVAKDTGLTPDKKILGGETKLAADSAAIGDTVTFEVTVDVPNTVKYEDHFVFNMNDQLPTGLTFTGITSVKVDSTTLADATKLATKPYAANDYDGSAGYYSLKIGDAAPAVTDGNYAWEADGFDPVATAGGQKVTVIFNEFKKFAEKNGLVGKGKKVTLTYTAVVNDDAQYKATANENEVSFKYSTEPNHDYDGDEIKENEPFGDTPVVKTRSYTTSLKIKKVDDKGKPLADAIFTLSGDALNRTVITGDRFELTTYEKKIDEEIDTSKTYWQLTDGSYTTTDPATVTNKTKYVDVNVKYYKVHYTFDEVASKETSVTVVTNSDGIAEFVGLNEGTYKLVEDAAPEGFNKIEGESTITITWSDPEATDAVSPAKDQGGFTLTATDFAQATSWNETGKQFEVTIQNKSGTELPSTGGIGTTMFYVVGAILVIGAGVLLVSRKRMNLR